MTNYRHKYENKTIRKPRNLFFTPKREHLQNYIMATLGGGDLHSAIKAPEGTQESEWLAINTVDFFNQIRLLVGCTSDVCTQETCPKMSAGAKYEFLWQFDRSKTASRCSAPIYCERMMDWVEDMFDDENIFPSSGEFPRDFRIHIKKIFKRFFRFYAHVYHEHLKDLEKLGELSHLNTCFKHFILFSQGFSLIDPKDMQPLATLISQIITVTK